jgi:hypothetical protein
MYFSRHATNAAMADDTPQRLNLLLSPGLLAALDEWRRQEKDIPTRSEAVRRLIAQSLKASGRIGTAGPTTKPRK